MSDFFCAYMGVPDECAECGGFNQTGTMFCSSDCAADQADRVAEMDAERQARRDREDAFALAADELRAQGRTEEEIDVLLAGMPT